MCVQALNLQAVNMTDMQQLVLHMPGQDLASQLQLAGMPGAMSMAQMQMGGMHMGGPKPSRDAVVGNIKEAVKLLMHASEELQVCWCGRPRGGVSTTGGRAGGSKAGHAHMKGVVGAWTAGGVLGRRLSDFGSP